MGTTIYTVCIRYFWQKHYRIYGHTRCICSGLANPTTELCIHITWEFLGESDLLNADLLRTMFGV